MQYRSVFNDSKSLENGRVCWQVVYTCQPVAKVVRNIMNKYYNATRIMHVSEENGNVCYLDFVYVDCHIWY
jgi:hypothetical protein